MKLLFSPLSPYVRKVRICAAMKGVAGSIEEVTADSNKGDPELLAANPLGKIPCLITDSGQAIYDSHVICEYVDSLAPTPVLFPKSGPERWAALTLAGLADGILDAALLMVYERRFRPESMVVQDWLDRQQAKVDRAVDYLEAKPPQWGSSPDYGHITTACALGYLDFRHEGKWRAKHPKMVSWLGEFEAAVPAFAATRPVA